ncbi:GntR family transcriptional regulator [Actinoplanes sp. TBRC 11911]|uniref:GntR family transcriptional regulator n=1 Tax=Actinoplanes sp. TBRC 11911 TaxID=2729386 RepID=UPI00145D33C8|nr:GntR family transcriptional regulator [Actinoplanes sp. TBRC 11911]NMO56223.1 GntR family transcriptional regulator [Actinoplanes sp. TBRC 11911]
MIIEVDPDGDVPIYQQLRDRVVEAIATGALKEGSPLPSTRALATDFGINFHTVNKAYDLLRRQRLLRINRKSGAVVSRDASSGPAEPEFVADWTGRATTLLAEATARGLTRDDILDICRTVLATFGEESEES